MRLSRQTLLGFMLVVAVAMLTGCSGINSSHSVSPATFLVPGLMQSTPQAEPPTEVDSLPLLAAASQ